MSDFDLRKFLAEQKAVKVETVKEAKDRNLDEEYEPGSIAPEDLYYSDKHGRLVAMDDVDDKYHDSLELVYSKGDKIEGPMDEKKGKDHDGDGETYHEGEDTMEEGDVTESILAGIAALVGGTVGLGKLLDYLKSKGFELTDPNGKSVLDTTIRGLKKEEETHEGEEMEEEIKENTFKSSIKDILNS